MAAPAPDHVAAPVAAPDRLQQVAENCDETVCLIETPDLYAVGQYYEDFSQVNDAEVIAILERFADHASTEGRV